MNLGQCGANQDSTRKTETETPPRQTTRWRPVRPDPADFPIDPADLYPPGAYASEAVSPITPSAVPNSPRSSRMSRANSRGSPSA